MEQATMPPYCGTRTTPPCPADFVGFERTQLILQLAGPNAGVELLDKLAREVDQHIVESLRQLALFSLRVGKRAN